MRRFAADHLRTLRAQKTYTMLSIAAFAFAPEPTAEVHPERAAQIAEINAAQTTWKARRTCILRASLRLARSSLSISCPW